MKTNVSADLDYLEERLQYVLARHSRHVVMAGDLNTDIKSDTAAITRLYQLLNTYSLQ